MSLLAVIAGTPINIPNILNWLFTTGMNWMQGMWQMLLGWLGLGGGF